MGSPPEDTAIRDLEQKALQSEAEWFVAREIPKVGRRIKRILQNCLAFLSPRGTKELELIKDLVPIDDEDDVIIPSLENANKLASFDTPEGLKGFISVGGWSIASADITVKFPKWNKGQPHKATVSNSHPWRLYQLQNAYNFAKMTLNELNLLIRQCEASQIPLPSDHPSSSSSSSSSQNLQLSQQTALAAVNKVVGQVAKWMALARDSLMLPNKALLFPNSLSNTISVYALHLGSGPLPMYDTPSQKIMNTVSSLSSNLSPNPLRISEKPLSPNPATPTSSATLAPPGAGMKHKSPSMNSLLNLPSSFTFGSLTSASSSEKGQSLAKVDESQEQGLEGISDAPSLVVPPAPATDGGRVNIGGTTYRTYQIVQRGVQTWVAVIEQTEVHCIVPRVNHTLSLLTSAINALADIEDKLVALSLL